MPRHSLAVSAACAAFWLVFVLHILAIWVPAYFVTQDGPSHLDNAGILLHYSTTAVYQQYLRVNTAPFPNWFGHTVEAALLTVFRPATAEKLFITGYVVLFPMAAWWAVRKQRRDVQWNAVLVFPIVLNCLLLYGFLNFCWSVCLFLVLVTYFRGMRTVGFSEWATNLLLALVLYFTHIFSWGLGASMVVIAAALRLRAGEWRWRTALLALSAFIPSLVLAAWFFWTQFGAVYPSASAVGFAHRWSALWRASTVVSSYGHRDVLISTTFGLLLTLLIAGSIANRRFNIWTVLTGIATVGYFASPPQSGIGQYVLERWNVYVLLGAALWVAAETRGRVAILALTTVTFAISVVNLNMLRERQRALNVELEQYLSALSEVPPGSTLLPVNFDSRGPGELQNLYGLPFRHSAHYAGVLRRLLVLDNYEAQTNVFPLIFREELNPGVFIGHMEDEPPAPDFADYGRATSGQVDYVLIWDPLRRAPMTTTYSGIVAQLQTFYRLVRSSGNGTATLYRRR